MRAGNTATVPETIRMISDTLWTSRRACQNYMLKIAGLGVSCMAHLPWGALDVLAPVDDSQVVHATAARHIASRQLAAAAAGPVRHQLHRLNASTPYIVRRAVPLSNTLSGSSAALQRHVGAGAHGTQPLCVPCADHKATNRHPASAERPLRGIRLDQGAWLQALVVSA